MSCIIEKLYLLLYQTVFSIGEVLGKCKGGVYIRCEMTPTSVGGEQQISISGGVNLPSDIACGRIAEAFLKQMKLLRVGKKCGM